MRLVICALLTLVAATSTALATARVTLVVRFDGRHSDSSVSEIKRELQRLMCDTEVELRWRRVEDLSAADSFPSLVVVTLHRSCQMNTLAPPPPNGGPRLLAYIPRQPDAIR